MFEVFWSPLPDFVADTHPVWLFPFQGGIAWHRTTKQSKHPKQIRQARSAWEWAAPPISSVFISAQRARTPWRTRWSGWCVMMWKQIISKAKIVCNTSVFYLDRNEPNGTVTTQYYIIGEKKYCLIQETNYDKSEECDDATMEAVNSFTWWRLNDVSASDSLICFSCHVHVK